MSNRDLYKMIDNLNHKIKKLDYQIKNKNFTFLPSNNGNNNKQQIISNSINNFKAYGINYPKTYDKNKKYIGLLFDENFNDFSSDNNNNSGEKLPFIKLSGGNNIINYSLAIEIDNSSIENYINHKKSLNNIITPENYSVSLGIREKSNSKVRIIKGSKLLFDLTEKNPIIGDKITINNTILYLSKPGEELCMIVELGSKFKILPGKSLIKILTL